MHADEHDHRHRKHDEQRLDQPPDQPGRHRFAPGAISCRRRPAPSVGRPRQSVYTARPMDAPLTHSHGIAGQAGVVRHDEPQFQPCADRLRARIPGCARHSVSREHRRDRREGQHPRHHRSAWSGWRRAVRSCRYRAGGRPGMERGSIHAAPRRGPAVRARIGRHEGLRLRLPRRGARISRRAISRARCTCSSATTRRWAATARAG